MEEGFPPLRSAQIDILLPIIRWSNGGFSGRDSSKQPDRSRSNSRRRTRKPNSSTGYCTLWAALDFRRRCCSQIRATSRQKSAAATSPAQINDPIFSAITRGPSAPFDRSTDNATASNSVSRLGKLIETTTRRSSQARCSQRQYDTEDPSLPDKPSCFALRSVDFPHSITSERRSDPIRPATAFRATQFGGNPSQRVTPPPVVAELQ